MTFASFGFICFVVLVVLLYFLTPRKYRWISLLVSSYAFFWMNSRLLVLILFGTTVITWLTGLWIWSSNKKNSAAEKQQAAELTREELKTLKEKNKKRKRRILILGIILNLGTLVVLKYTNFVFSDIERIAGAWGGNVSLPRINLLLPIGISFYTLQSIAYLVDIYRNKTEPDRNPGKFMLFMSFFPQIVQGPIARHHQLAHQLYEGHDFDYRRLKFGIQLMLWGWIKKLVIADRLAIPVNEIFNHYGSYSGLLVFLGAAMYGIQVYADFSGGMDIARGVAHILGIELELNFKQPYFSVSIEDFWRRWHITLGGWMRDYIFYPLSLSRPFASLSRKTRKILGPFIGKRLPSFLAMFIVYFLVGLWHGPDWKYILYGVWNGIFIVSGIVLEKAYDTARKKSRVPENSITWKLFQMVRTFILITFGRFFSRALDSGAAIAMIGASFHHWWDLSFLLDGTMTTLGLDQANWNVLLAAILLVLCVDYLHEKGVRIREAISRQWIVFRWLIYIAAVLFILIFGIYGPEYNAASFIYQQF